MIVRFYIIMSEQNTAYRMNEVHRRVVRHIIENLTKTAPAENKATF